MPARNTEGAEILRLFDHRFAARAARSGIKGLREQRATALKALYGALGEVVNSGHAARVHLRRMNTLDELIAAKSKTKRGRK